MLYLLSPDLGLELGLGCWVLGLSRGKDLGFRV